MKLGSAFAEASQVARPGLQDGPAWWGRRGGRAKFQKARPDAIAPDMGPGVAVVTFSTVQRQTDTVKALSALKVRGSNRPTAYAFGLRSMIRPGSLL